AIGDAAMFRAIGYALLIAMGLSSPGASAQSSAVVEKRVALVIGNANYKNIAPLATPRADAELVANSLRKANFHVVEAHTDLGYTEFNAALRAFSREATTADWAMVYYTGHGIE